MPKILPLASPTAGNDNSLAKAAAICPSSLPDQGETLQAEVQAEAKTAASEEGPVTGSEGGFAEARTLQEAEPAKKRGSANKGRASRNKASAAAKSRKRKA